MTINTQEQAEDYLQSLRVNDGFDAERYAEERNIEMAEEIGIFDYEFTHSAK